MSVTDQAAPPTEEVPLGRNRSFLLLWLGAGMSFLSSRISAVAYSLLVLWATGSTVAAGLVGMAALLPNLVVQLPAGALVDRWNLRRVMIVCDVGRLLAIGSVAVAVFNGHVWLPHLMIVAFVENSLTVFYRLAERSAVREVVPRSQLSPAMSRNEARAQAATLLGQPIGGLLFTAFRWLPFGVTAIGHLVSLVTVLFIHTDLSAGRQPAARKNLADDVREGFRWVWGETYLRRALLLIAAGNILFQVLGLATVKIVYDSGGSPAVVGFVNAVVGAGGLVGALTAQWWMNRLGIRRIIIFLNLTWALLMPVLAFVQHPALLALVLGLMVYGGGVSNVAGLVYQMKTTPGHMQGRAGSISMLLTSGASSAGALAAGFLLDAFSTTSALLVTASAMWIMFALTMFWFGGRKRAEMEKEWEDPTRSAPAASAES